MIHEHSVALGEMEDIQFGEMEDIQFVKHTITKQ